ncbi:MAG: protein kinase [Gammaproteobacteria bacterium]|nr:protein kinase [Gammaproteobacteria bacterium]
MSEEKIRLNIKNISVSDDTHLTENSDLTKDSTLIEGSNSTEGYNQAEDSNHAEGSKNLTIIQLKSSKSVTENDKTIIVKPISEKNDSSVIDSVTDDELDKTKIHIKSKEYQDKTKLINPNSSQDRFNKLDNNHSQIPSLGIESIINKRFVLKEILGVGGMGKVYKAIDLRKLEAHDKNPFVAIKVLNDEFRNHPESLIALQREARKSQQLSHPNIVNVHDFDRDGDVVYMMMELLQGRPLDLVIKEDFPHGMSEEEATPIINSLSNALLHAHEHGIVHSDIKPSNIFITENNKAKIFDFGIARACQLSQSQLNDEISNKTMFDPTELGALTPTYASLEMLEGKAPEPNDDIYSIACVFYEMLTGKHPYKRLPANNVKAKKVKLDKIRSFSRSYHTRKSNALFKALELNGRDRYKSIEQFLQDYNYKKKSRKTVYLSIVVLIFILLIVFYQEIEEQINFSQQSEFIIFVNNLDFEHNKEYLKSIRDHINSLDVKTKNYVLENIKNKWLIFVESKINHLSNHESQKQASYNEVNELLELSQLFYPDSANVAHLFESYEKQKFNEINTLNSQFNELLEILQYSELSSNSIEQEQLLIIISRIKQIEATHPLLVDQRLLLIYQNNIERLINDFKTEEAKKLLVKAKIIFHDDITLQNLMDKLKSTELIDLDNSEINNEQESVLSSLNISKLKEKLTTLLLRSNEFDDWDKEVTSLYVELSKKLGRHSIWLNEKKQTLASLYLKKSVSMRDDKRYVESRRFLDKAKHYNNAIFGLQDEEAILQALENIVRVKHRAKQQLANIEGLKTSLNIQLKAEEMEAAIRTYNDIKRILGRNDPFVSRDASLKIAQTYYKKGRSLFKLKKYEQTIENVDNGLKFAPQHSGLRLLRKNAIKQKKLLEDSLLLAKVANTTHEPEKITSDIEHQSNKPESEPKKIINDRCKIKFAGYGRKKRANCYDSINQQINAPVLVVVPAMNKNEKAFAVSKYEITINDYNQYCQLTGDCKKKAGNSSLPVTDISVSMAKKYVDWLSKTTSKNYSIPTSEQWLHAAKTNKATSYNDVNCRIKFGTKLLKGQNLLSANTGQSNPWGIMNIVGNAREFVIDQSKTIARGGAYNDSINNCTVDSKQTNIGSGDIATGFRVIRMIN